MAFFLVSLYGKSGGKYPEFVLFVHLLMEMVYGLASALVGGFLLASVIAVLNEAGFFAPWSPGRLRAWTHGLMLFTGITVAGIYLSSATVRSTIHNAVEHNNCWELRGLGLDPRGMLANINRGVDLRFCIAVAVTPSQ